MGATSPGARSIRQMRTCSSSNTSSVPTGLSSVMMIRLEYGAPTDGFDHAHIGDGVGERDRHRTVVDDCLRKGITLQRGLVAPVEQLLVDGRAVLKPQPTGSIGRRIERDLDLD